MMNKERRWIVQNAETRKDVSTHVRIDTPDGKQMWWEHKEGGKGLPDGIKVTDLAL